MLSLFGIAREDAQAQKEREEKTKQEDAQNDSDSPEVFSLVTTCLAPHVYPLQIFSNGRDAECKQQPLLVFPAPHPDPGRAVTNILLGWSSCCSIGDSPAPAPPRWSELEWGDQSEADVALLREVSQDPSSGLLTASQESTHRLLSPSDEAADGIVRARDGYMASALGVGLEEVAQGHRESDGFFVGRRSLLSGLLMSGEEVM